MKKILYVFAILIIIISPFLGEITINIKDIFNLNDSLSTVFCDLRVPRVILAFFVGSILAMGGLIFQIVFKNELITPYTLGIASGTTLFSAICIVFFPLIPLFFSSIFGSLITIIILFLISKKLNKKSLINSTNSMLLIGIALSYFYSSALMLIFFISNLQENYSIVRFTLGSLDTVGFIPTLIVGFTVFFVFIFIFRIKHSINLLLISNDVAFLKGLNVDKTILTILIFITICVGICISFTGTIVFGGVFLAACDLISRILPTASALPIGVVTSFRGAPFFVYLLIRKKEV